ncbi:ketopantoate reductase family protein [Paenibacillus whitsoniae]|uniref:2-dehydropantoate 2-reductase n=1 Tax=Paenibacillus whitsoniae TaxID=2496558 RepID=A0A3S0AMH2_9BACL|nr:2-dehydropantoate 2-reductase [Paenibacillus whitsoniae]RTE07696.1 2-dehydropantoate 2-reductase [Paenibacillus whitsoniae]
MRMTIIGGGSLGLLFAAKLVPLCKGLTLIARTREQAETLAQGGIAIQEMSGERRIVSHTDISIECYNGSADETVQGLRNADYVLLMLKQPAITETLLARLQSELAPQACLICFQNGIGHEHKVIGALGAGRVLFAVTTEGAKREGGTAVRHTGHGVTYIGGLTSEMNDNLLQRHCSLKEVLLQAGFQADLSKNMEERIWNKLAINCVINPLTAILKVTNGQLLDTAWTRSLMADLFRETSEVAEAYHVSLAQDLWTTIVQVCQATSANHSSMLQDVLGGRPTEIDYLNGSLVSMAGKAGLALPNHNMVYRLVKAMEG